MRWLYIYWLDVCILNYEMKFKFNRRCYTEMHWLFIHYLFCLMNQKYFFLEKSNFTTVFEHYNEYNAHLYVLSWWETHFHSYAADSVAL